MQLNIIIKDESNIAPLKWFHLVIVCDVFIEQKLKLTFAKLILEQIKSEIMGVRKIIIFLERISYCSSQVFQQHHTQDYQQAVAMAIKIIFIYSITLCGNALLLKFQTDLSPRAWIFLMEFSKVSCTALEFNLRQHKNNTATNISFKSIIYVFQGV